MPLNYFEVQKPTIWKVEDYFTCQQHNLSFNTDGIGVTTATDIMYDGRVLQVDVNGNIKQAILQHPIEDGKYEQNTMPLKKVASILNGTMELQTYEPYYQQENPAVRYLFTIVAGARNEN